MKFQRVSVLLFVVGLFLQISCGQKMHPFEENIQPLDGSYIIVKNATAGIYAEDMQIFINGEYVQELAAGESTVSIPVQGNQTYAVEGQSSNGVKLWPKIVDLAKDHKMVVTLGKVKSDGALRYSGNRF